jgi:Protein kinase domain
VNARTRRRVGRYEIIRVIGRGGMATVHLARQLDLDRDVALKELALADTGPATARRFLREARLAGSLNHPNIVVVHDYLVQDDTPYIAMEYVARGSLRPYVGRLSLPQVGGVLVGVLGGLAHAEERGIVHRDLKPENIMASSQGGVKIADFGIAKALTAAHGGTQLTTAGTTLGTPRYMSPERAMGEPLGPWTDLYSVGAIAFELLVGQAPFAETEEPMAILMRQINDPIPPVRSLVPDVDAELSDWVGRLLEKDPQARTPSAAAAADTLDEILGGVLGARWQRSASLPDQPGTRTATTLPQPPAARTRSRPVPLAVPAAAEAATVAPRTARRSRRWRAPMLALVALVAVALAVVPGRGGGVLPAGSLHEPGTGVDSHRDPGSEQSALGLAGDYTQAARRVDALAPTAANVRRAVRLRRTAQAYRAAADAARREDGSDYDDAMARAAALAPDGAGDSRSDDASDDEPDEDDNGD